MVHISEISRSKLEIFPAVLRRDSYRGTLDDSSDEILINNVRLSDQNDDAATITLLYVGFNI